jgi:ketosteroid isomerase-like protein
MAQSGLSKSETEKAQAEIEAARVRFEQAVARGDFQALAGMLAEGAMLVRPATSEWREFAAAAKGAPFPPNSTIRIRPLETKVLNREWAYSFGASVVTYRRGGKDSELRDTFLVLLRNTGDGWKVFREVASASPPPGGWPQTDKA